MTLTAITVSTSLLLTENRPLRFATFFYLYVMQGVPAGFATTALANYLAGQNLSSARVGEFVAIVGAPWAFQFLWGPLIDRFQGSSMGRRRPWVIGSQILALLASVGIGTVGDPVSNIYALSVAFFVHSVCVHPCRMRALTQWLSQPFQSRNGAGQMVSCGVVFWPELL